MIKIDGVIFDFINISPKLADKFKDFEMLNGDIVRYNRRKNVVSLSCKGLVDKSELDILQSNNAIEHTVEYQLNGIQTAIMLIDSFSFRKLALCEQQEFWEVTFNLKECRRE